MLSPALTHRLITQDELLTRTLARQSFHTVEKFIQEVHWRAYWKGWLQMRPQVWQSYRKSLNMLACEAAPEIRQQCQEIEHSASGIALVDEWMRELRETGYLHNHVRMWFAGYWIHTRKLPWHLGAALFEKYLCDFDAASNTLSWRWVAGLQTNGKCYLPSVGNILKYDFRSQQKEFSHNLHKIEPQAPAQIQEEVSTEPVELLDDLSSSFPKCTDALVIHSEHLCAKETIFAQTNTQHIFVLCPDMAVQTPPRAAWLSTAFADTIARITAIEGKSPEALSLHPSKTSLASILCKRKVTSCVMIAPNVGPLADTLCEEIKQIRESGVQLTLVTPLWDASQWPEARKGYFPFWEKVRKTYLK